MTFDILGIAFSTASDLENLNNDPSFRKATKNMQLAHLALKMALKKVDQKLEVFNRERIATFIGSGHGELGSTMDFLKGINILGRQKPICFQNSLHNATLGFITKSFALTGPGFTLSNRFFSAEDSISIALDFLEAQLADLAIVIGADSIVAELADSMRLMYPSGVTLSDGAGAIILSRTNFFAEFSPVARIKHPTFNYTKKAHSSIFTEYYDSNAIAKIATHLESSNDSDLILQKPDGSSSKFVIQK